MDDYRAKSLASGRRKGAVGTKPTAVTKYVLGHVPKTKGILDYGAGKFLQQTKILESAGYTVFAHDLEENMAEWEPGYNLSFYEFEVILLSNVLNVLVNPLNYTIEYVIQRLAPNGTVIFNLPKEPNISGVTAEEVIGTLLWNKFHTISNIDGNVYVAHKYPGKNWTPYELGSVARRMRGRREELEKHTRAVTNNSYSAKALMRSSWIEIA